MSDEISFMIPGRPGLSARTSTPGVPPQDRVGRHDGRHSPQDPATESLALRREASAMVVGQPDASAFHLLFEDTVLSAKYSRTSYWWRFTHPASHEQ